MNKNYKSFFGVLSLFYIVCISLCIGCANDENTSSPDPATDPDSDPITSTPNILFIIGDDIGLDPLNGYTEGSQKAITPNLDKIRNNGLTFNNAWVYPTCSPTRASIITGKYGFHTNVLAPGDELGAEHQILQNYIAAQTNNAYTTAVIGKWHLHNNNFNPESLGIDYYAGILSGGVRDYYSWDFTEDGVTETEETYTTEKFTDLSIDWINNQSKPWFLWLAYNAAHTPFHVPPSNMHSQGDLSTDANTINSNSLPYYLAAIEAMDYQIGKLLDAMSDEVLANTYIIFLGDNGTPAKVAQTPFSNRTAKGSINQGGINVPMFISGPGVTRTGEEDALVTGTDFFASIASLAGVSVDEIHDSKNFTPLLSAEQSTIREFAYSEQNNPDADKDEWCIRNEQYKLIELTDGTQRLYNLSNDPYESTNLMNSGLSESEEAIRVQLAQQAANIRQ